MYTGTIVFGDWRYKVPDLPVARVFYCSCFGVEPYFDEPEWVVFEIQDYRLWLEPVNLSGESVFESSIPSFKLSNQTGLNFWQVGDINEVCDRFRNLGGTILKAPLKRGSFTDAIVEDPWGNSLGLHSILI